MSMAIFFASGIRASPESVGVGKFYRLRLRLRAKQPTLTDSDSGSDSAALLFYILDLVWIRLFRPVRAITEPWDEGDGIEWAKMAVDRVAWQWLCFSILRVSVFICYVYVSSYTPKLLLRRGALI